MPRCSLNTRISTLAAIGAAWFGIIQVLPAHAESCYPQFCVTPTVTRAGSGWNVHLKVRLTNYRYNEAHLKINGGSQIDLSSSTNVIDTGIRGRPRQFFNSNLSIRREERPLSDA